jgi:hypothetical protein
MKDLKNFLTDYRPHTCNETRMVSINEANAKQLIDKHSKNGFIIVSPCRGYEEFNLDGTDSNDRQKLNEINNKRVKQMISLIKKSGYSYTPVYGGFIENKGTDQEETVYEKSFIIFNYNKKGESGDLQELFNFGVELSKEFNQDSFLYKAPNENPKYFTKDGELDFDLGNKTSFNDFSEEYFTDLHKNTNKYSGESGRKPTRITFTESYINPAPQGYSERHVRYLNGEIFLSK